MRVDRDLYTAESLRAFAHNSYVAMGAKQDEVPTLVDQIMDATMRGHPGQGQGIEKLPRLWERFQGGTIIPGALLQTVAESESWTHLDANKGWGPVMAAKAMDLAVDKALLSGIALSVVRRSNHFGTSGYHAARATRQGVIGLCMTNAGPEMAPWGGITPILGTNPWGIAVPRAPFPLVLDMAMTQSGKGMIHWFLSRGMAIPSNWAYAPDGSETNDPKLALEGPLVPIGEFKGTGLSLMTDILAGVMSGSAFGADTYRNPSEHNVGHFMLAINPTIFMDPDIFATKIESLIAEFKASEKKDNIEEILLPGEIEHRRLVERSRDGVPVDPNTVSELRAFASELGIQWTGCSR